MSFERGEDRAALVRRVTVLEQVTSHACSLPPHGQEPVTVPSEHLVGRADELDLLERLLEDLDRGGPGAVQVAGEPGIGKTRLLRELAARAEVRGHLVLGGSGSEFEHDLPFSVFVDALDEYLRGLDPEGFAALDDHVRAELAHIFPSLWALAPDLSAQAAQKWLPSGTPRFLARHHHARRPPLERSGDGRCGQLPSHGGSRRDPS